MVPYIAIVTPAKATYFKPLYEAFCAAQPEPWRTLLVWPEAHKSEHPPELLTPVADNLEIARVGRAKFTSKSEAFQELSKREVRAVLIHEYSAFSLQGLLFAKRRGIPVIVSTEVGKANAHFFSLKTRLWHGFWSRMVDGIVACSPAAHEPLSGRKLPSVSAYHAVDSRLYAPIAKKTSGPNVIFAYVGQIIHRKGLDLWLTAAASLKSKGYTNFRLRFIGTGQDSWLKQLVENAGLQDQVEYAGFLSGEELRVSIRESDVFVLPTRQDTYAAVVHEAACLGLPLIVSKHAGAALGIVSEGENGRVIDPENAEEFATVMEQFLDENVRSRMASAARISGEDLSAHQRGVAVWQWMDRQFSLTKESNTQPSFASAIS